MGDNPRKGNKKSERLVKSISASSLLSKKIEIPTIMKDVLRSMNANIDVGEEVKNDVRNKIEINEMN